MVYTGKLGGRDAFWHALLFTIFIFASGLFIGFLFENARVNSAEQALYSSEINLLDQQVRTKVISDFNISCEAAKKELFSFADSVYGEALQLEDYDSASKFDDILPILHKRYDLLRMMIWAESLQLNARCPDKFHRVVYFYTYSSDNPETIGTQSFYSRLLSDVKGRIEDEMLLVPIAVNTNISSVDLTLEKYHISKLPAILIDEKTLITEVPTADELEELILKDSN